MAEPRNQIKTTVEKLSAEFKSQIEKLGAKWESQIDDHLRNITLERGDITKIKLLPPVIDPHIMRLTLMHLENKYREVGWNHFSYHIRFTEIKNLSDVSYWNAETKRDENIENIEVIMG